jgi:hypothetical protein
METIEQFKWTTEGTMSTLGMLAAEADDLMLTKVLKKGSRKGKEERGCNRKNQEDKKNRNGQSQGFKKNKCKYDF